MDAEKNEVPNLFGQFKAYLNTRLKYIRYQAAIKGTAVAADIVAESAVLFCYLLVFLFASVTLGSFLASFFESFWAGFGCLALIYLVIGIIVVVFKRRIKRPIINALLHKIIK